MFRLFRQHAASMNTGAASSVQSGFFLDANNGTFGFGDDAARVARNLTGGFDLHGFCERSFPGVGLLPRVQTCGDELLTDEAHTVVQSKMGKRAVETQHTSPFILLPEDDLRG
jgi:hypothetical protein